jgi:glycosyltransferase involved in cell wall biosynthesis
VAVVTDALYPWHKGGKEVRYLHLLRGLAERDMDVVVFSMKWWDRIPDIQRNERGSLTYFAICPRVPLYHGRRRSIGQAVLFALSTLRLLGHNFDVIEADHMPYLQLVPLRFVAWTKRVPLVVTWNEVWGKDRWRSYVGRMGSVAALVERISMELPDAIVAVSDGTAKRLEAVGAKSARVSVIPVALDLERLMEVVPNSEAPELLFVGRLLEHKHADLVVQATKLLVDRGLDVRLGIVGVGPQEAQLRSLVQTSHLDLRVTFYSTIESQIDLWSLMCGSRVLLAPSVREGFGLAVAESLALGTPVVCVLHEENESSNLIGASTGSLVPPFDAVALADAAEFWLSEGSSRQERVAAFLSEHAELTADAMSDSYAELLRKVS